MITHDTTIEHPFAHDVMVGAYCVAQMEGTLHITRSTLNPDTWMIAAVEIDGTPRDGRKRGSITINGDLPQYKPLYEAICAEYDADDSPERWDIDLAWAEAEAERRNEGRSLPIAA